MAGLPTPRASYFSYTGLPPGSGGPPPAPPPSLTSLSQIRSSQWVPEKGYSVFFARPTLPSVTAVRPSRKPNWHSPRLPWHCRLTWSNPTPPGGSGFGKSLTFHAVPMNGGRELGARPTVQLPVTPSRKRPVPSHSKVKMPGLAVSCTIHLVPSSISFLLPCVWMPVIPSP
jgi:hypothetical protein